MVRLRVGEILKDRGMSVQEFADASKLNYRTALDIAKGRYERMGLETIDKICDALQVTPGDIYDYQPNKHN